MPQIIIRENDNTTAGGLGYSNFTVVVPGFISADGEEAKRDLEKDNSIFDENGVYECANQAEFIKKVGCIDTVNMTITNAKEGSKEKPTASHFGNQMAYELLGLGYKVLYLNLGIATPGKDNEVQIPADTWNLALTKLKNEQNNNELEALKDKSAYDFRYIVTGMLEDNLKINNAMTAIAKFRGEDNEGLIPTDSLSNGRGDCIALLDVDENEISTDNMQATNIQNIKKWTANLDSSKYSALFTPAVIYNSDKLHKPAVKDVHYTNSKFPATFHYLACAINSARKNFAEWYAVAGYTRGITSYYKIESTSVKLGEAAINALQPRTCTGSKENLFNKSVNVIAKIRDSYYIWGNRTTKELDTEGLKAGHFLNIRQLCTTIKKQAYLASRKFTFDPNSDILWINWKSVLTPMLERMKSDQGITDYRLIKVKADKKAMLKAKIRIIPIEAVEDFDIELSLEDSFGEPTITDND